MSRIPNRSRSGRGPGRRAARGLGLLGLAFAAAATLLPFAWMVLGSVKTEGELIERPITWWPETFTLDHYVAWFERLHFPVYLANSAIVAVAVTAGNAVFCSMAGWALAKTRFPGRRAFFALIMVMLMVPGIVTTIPLFVLIVDLGLANSYASLILPFVSMPFGVFLMRQYMLSLDDDVLDAARIDGAGEWGLLWRIAMPQCVPAVATLSIFVFLSSWNSFLWPLIAAQTQDMYTLPVALSLSSSGKAGPEYGTMMAGAVLVVVPVLVLFFFMQRSFMSGTTFGQVRDDFGEEKR